MLSVPKDYFEEFKKVLGTEFTQRYVEKTVCNELMSVILAQILTLRNEMNVLRERLNEYETSSVKVEEVEELKIIPEDEAYEKISEYIKTNPGCRTSQIISGLGINPDLALRVLHRLQREKKVKGKDIERI